MERDTDVEKGRAEEVSDGNCAPEGIEKSTTQYCKGAGKSTESNANLLPNEDDPKVMEKRGLDTEISEVLPGSVEVPKPNPAPFQIGDDTAIRASSARAPKQSNLDRGDTDNSEIVRRFPGEVMQSTSDSSTSSGISTTGHSLTECQLAYRTAMEGAENARCAESSCRELVGFVEKAVDEIQRQGDEFSRRARIESDRGETSPYFTLAEKYCAYVRILKRKAARLESAANAALTTACSSDNVAFGISELTNEDEERAKYSAYVSKKKSDDTCAIAYKVQHRALRLMKILLTNLKNSAIELQEHSENSCQRCLNRNCKCRIVIEVAHVAGFVLGVGVLASLALLEVGKTLFYAILCPGVALVAWTVIYWCRKLHQHLRSRGYQIMTETDIWDDFVEEIDGHLLYLQEYLVRHAKDKSPLPSDTDVEDSGLWETTEVATGDE